MSPDSAPAIITLREVYDAVQELKGEMAGTPTIVQDHERRLRVLEQRVWQAAGGAAALGAIIGLVGERIFNG
ncbi:hypothetical protein DBB34_09145 [Sphaerisporangium cinnabarinum]|nr:hypothetical protein [Sphaerisporangium cinnabarinum]PTU56417.1 hypothetical protein DBB34_09145 [Sphaerisporangium cinnabarinum]